MQNKEGALVGRKNALEMSSRRVGGMVGDLSFYGLRFT